MLTPHDHVMAVQRMQCKLFPMEIPSRIHLLNYLCRVLGKYGMVGLQPETLQLVVKCLTTQTSMIQSGTGHIFCMQPWKCAPVHSKIITYKNFEKEVMNINMRAEKCTMLLQLLQFLHHCKLPRKTLSQQSRIKCLWLRIDQMDDT